MAYGLQKGGVALVDSTGKEINAMAHQICGDQSPRQSGWTLAGRGRESRTSGNLEYDRWNVGISDADPIGTSGASIAWSSRNHLAITSPSDIRIVSPENRI